ncbi:DUF1569 domain-containing protein [Flavobacterium terrigena]|uniref:DinB superfamily protein n=1 Tax=Flavobacterium terrigena TaxID=402734 RepID=A0A1H6SP79_9FLAO|nr:DUF1569 domain-containing protein [Flavobacterium terrigena]SEI69739.1 Protein of unknown function [Flavobacterium terrigena]
MSKLHNILLQLENHIPNLEKTNSKISSSTIGWQIDHCLLVINGVMSQLEISNPAEFKSKFNLNKLIVFTTGKIPRGKIRAPKVVTPISIATVEELKSNIEIAKNKVSKLNNLPKNSFFKHPFLSDLNAKQTEKFLAIHTKHHLKIIEDILK